MIKPMKAYAVVCGDKICGTFDDQGIIFEEKLTAERYAYELKDSDMGMGVSVEYKVIEVTIRASKFSDDALNEIIKKVKES